MSQSTQDLERVIRRRQMNRGQVTLLKYLYEANGFIPRDDVVEAVRWGDHGSFRSVLSAFSNRINETEGITGEPGYEAFIERRTVDGEEQFRLREEARQAVEAVPALLEAFDRPMEELLDNQGVPVSFESMSLARDRGAAELERGSWEATSGEDRLLVGYWKDAGGVVVTEVHIGKSGPGDWPDGTGQRRIDGLRFATEYSDEITSQKRFDQSTLQDLIADRHVEVIEVKRSLNRPVIGQAIAGRDMLMRDYDPRTVEPVVVCEEGDPGLEWVCRRNGIRVGITEQTEYD